MKSLHVIFLVSIQLLMCFIFVARYTQFQSVKIFERYSKPCNIASEYVSKIHPKSKDSIRKGNVIDYINLSELKLTSNFINYD